MPTRAIPYVKALLHLLCLAPLFRLLHYYTSGAMALNPDPVQLITHFTGNWALYILLASLAVTPIRRLSPKLSNLIRFRRLLGLYAFFYATLHLATYVFLFSGYDVVTAFAGLKAGHPVALWEQAKLVWPTIWDDLKKRTFIQIGLFAWVVLFALALTSPTFMLRAMGGRNWQLLHRMVYFAAAAAVLHYWWSVKKGVLAPWRETAVLAVLLLARLVWTLLKRRRSSAASVAVPQ